MKTNGIQFIPKENETFTLEECNIFTVNDDTIVKKKSKKYKCVKVLDERDGCRKCAFSKYELFNRYCDVMKCTTKKDEFIFIEVGEE